MIRIWSVVRLDIFGIRLYLFSMAFIPIFLSNRSRVLFIINPFSKRWWLFFFMMVFNLIVWIITVDKFSVSRISKTFWSWRYLDFMLRWLYFRIGFHLWSIALMRRTWNCIPLPSHRLQNEFPSFIVNGLLDDLEPVQIFIGVTKSNMYSSCALSWRTTDSLKD